MGSEIRCSRPLLRVRRGRTKAKSPAGSDLHRDSAKEAGVRYRVNRRAKPGQKLTDYEKRINRSRSRSRARGEHPFRIVKQLWGFSKVRYRGIAKNLARAEVAFALANLYALRRKLMPPQARCAL